MWDECHYAKCCYAKCSYAECRYAEYLYGECHDAELDGDNIKGALFGRGKREVLEGKKQSNGSCCPSIDELKYL